MDRPPDWKAPTTEPLVKDSDAVASVNDKNNNNSDHRPSIGKRKRKEPGIEPPSKLRSIVTKHRNMGDKNANADKRSYLGALKYLPHAVYKLIENMPAPWESSKDVEVLYHSTGAITFVAEQPEVDVTQYMANWGLMWDQMRAEKRDRNNFRRMRLPPFDDEEKLPIWSELTALYPDIPDAVPLKPVENGEISSGTETGSQGKVSAWRPSKSFEQLVRSEPFIVRRAPPSIYDKRSFAIAKQLQMQVPNGPRFEPPGGVGVRPPAPSTFDDPQRIIVRNRTFPVRVEIQVAFPFLYGNPNLVDPHAALPVYEYPAHTVIPRHDNKRAFFTDSSVNRVPEVAGSEVAVQNEWPEFLPFLHDFEFESEEIAEALALYHAPYPFNEPTDVVKRTQDVTLVKPLYTQRRPLRVMRTKTRRSYQRLLKRATKNQLLKRHHAPSGSGNQHVTLLKLLEKTKFFARTRIDWLEAGVQLCDQGHQILQLLIHKRGLHFMHLDYNFNLKPMKTLTTKERKRSRFGNAFHLVRELLKLTKLLVDCHLQFRMGNADGFELADALNYIFTHTGQLTGIYRYKYKVMHQITACSDIKHVILDRFNLDGVGKGPGCGIWQPTWRIWLEFLRGNLPMLERWLGNLIQRMFFGRVSKGIAKTVTKQRIDSHYDLELRAAVLHDIVDVMPPGLRESKTKVVMEHLSEAWRCWKANIPWDVPGMPVVIQTIINRYIQARAEHWITVAHQNRERIRAGKTVDKAVARKNLGRLTRLWMRAEQERQEHYASEGPSIEPEDAVLMYKTMASFLKETDFCHPIAFPISTTATDTKLLTLALETLRDGYNMQSRLTNTQREELAAIEQAYDNPHEALANIKRTLLSDRVFENVEVSLLDFHSHLSPVYHVNASEKIVDAYLDQYLWYEADRSQLFPNWVKPSDDEVTPVMVYKFCEQLNNLPRIWNNGDDETSALIHLKLRKFLENVDLTLLNQLLKLIMDKPLADYITAKMNASISFKDMLHVNQVGIIRGFQFSSFVVQYYLLMIDILLMGLPRAVDFARTEFHQGDHLLKLYMRYLDDVYMVFHLSRDDADELVDSCQNPVLPVYPLKTCWPRDRMMRMIRQDMQVGRCLFDEVEQRVPDVLGSIDCLDASIVSVDNPALIFDMAGFEVRVQPGRASNDEEAMWALVDPNTRERTGYALVKVSQESINRFANRVRQVLMTSGSTTFAKIVKRWNTALIALAAYFREAAIATPELLDVIVKCEIRVQNKVKMGLNSKMPARFPPCVFYSPEELGGLGMLSASHIMIPASDLYNKTTRYNYGITEDDGSVIPNLFRYVNSWEAEVTDSQRVWTEYALKRSEAQATETRVSPEDMEEIWDRGLPRISTLFQRDRAVLSNDKGFRVRQEYKNFSNERYDPFWWTNSQHDGRLWNFNNYRTDTIQALGGIQSILEHTLFKGTGFDDWEGLFWQKQSGFEQQMQMQKLTNAQRAGLSQIPNRRFTLWWSPTINRANVYIGFLVQLDLTGIFLHGKIPTLKISYIQIFRNHLWQKIHESLVLDLCQVLDKEQSVLQIDSIEKLLIHPRKSYRMNASAADILLKSIASGLGSGWSISKPSGLGHNDDVDKFDHTTSSEFWIDIQLRFGDFDSHDITRYSRAKFLDYTSDGVSHYPSQTGLMVCIDLAYNTCDAYGNWFPGLKRLIRAALAKIIQSNSALYILRERLRKALQLHQSQPKQPLLSAANYLDVMGEDTAIVDDTAVYHVTMHKTKHGNMASKPINGALFTFRPSSGQVYLQTIHAETAWAGQKKLGAVSKWKAAEEVAGLLRTFNSEDLPKQLIIGTRGLRDPMEVNMLEFSGISVRNTELNLPFAALLHLDSFKSLVDAANSSSSPHQFNLYDDWLTISQPSTAFSRLMLLLRGLTVNAESTLMALNRCPESSGFWPTLSRDEWIELENEISEIVIEEYGKSNCVNTQSLTQSEVRDIILGQRVVPPSEQRQQLALESSKAQGPAMAVATKSHNVHGDEITVVTQSQYEKQKFESKNTWRNRALEATSSLQYRSGNLITFVSSKTPIEHFIVPHTLVQDFVAACDVRNFVIGLLYGKMDNHQATVESIAVVPQLGSTTNIMFSPIPTYLPDFEGLELLGFIRSQPNPRGDRGVPPVDLSLLSLRPEFVKSPRIIVLLNFNEGEIEVQAMQPTDAGVQWGAQNRDFLSAEPMGYDADEFATCLDVKLSTSEGFFYVPQDDVWNFAFMSAIWNSQVEPFMKVGMPIQYYDGLHRAIHYSAMQNSERTFQIEDFD